MISSENIVGCANPRSVVIPSSARCQRCRRRYRAEPLGEPGSGNPSRQPEESVTTVATTEGRMQWDGMTTWYRVVGDRHGAGAPVVVCHGGPGLTHDYL